MTTKQDQPDAFDYDPDYRRQPKDFTKPFCCRCQQNLDPSKAVAVTINEESMMAMIGHNRDAELHPNPHHPELTNNAWIGKDCLARLRKQQKDPE